VAGVTGYLIWSLVRDWKPIQVWISTALAICLVLVTLTSHAAVQAAFINYDNPTEYLVYAHGGRGIKEALAQIEELSYRTSDGLAMEVAFDNETTYPFWWYLRNYENQRYYGENPTRDLRNSPVILVGNNNYAKLEPVVGNAYYEFTYNRIVWPNQDYYNLTWERIGNALSDPDIREGIFRIWLMRDYQKYAQATNKSISLANWNPADQMKLYVRKDVAARVWNYGSMDLVYADISDPYEGKELTLEAAISLNQLDLISPRNLEIAPDGSLYLLDTGNNQVLHLSADGELLHSWGKYGNSDTGSALPGSFNEPWGIAISSDGYVFIADTWNHRIQKFTAEGVFITSWGEFGLPDIENGFYGPRDIVIDPTGRVFVTDTGNKRISVHNSEGDFLYQIGVGGYSSGELDEPVGVALNADGDLVVADTWNLRIQMFSELSSGNFNYLMDWKIEGWYGQSIANKPFLAVGPQNQVCVTDPEGYRVLCFTAEGEYLFGWGAYGSDSDQFILPSGIAFEPNGAVWVVDSGNNRIMRFNPPWEE
ncbi:MAG: hypothetical protein KAS36_02400, partial [Anaerolineales bacterium]|nr:hypothetical protein [Anaerolineales bacterium]